MLELEGELFFGAVGSLDRALEIAENTLLANFRQESEHLVTTMHDAVSFLKGVSDSVRSHIEALMPQQFDKSGAILFRTGDESDRLLLVLQGSAGMTCDLPAFGAAAWLGKWGFSTVRRAQSLWWRKRNCWSLF